MLLHMAAEIDRGLPVVFIDTGKLFGETLRYRDKLVAQLGLTNLKVLRPEAAAVAAQDPEGVLWHGDPDACCAMRKVAPLGRRACRLRGLGLGAQALPWRPARLPAGDRGRGRARSS